MIVARTDKTSKAMGLCPLDPQQRLAFAIHFIGFGMMAA
jgi:hypothetical protein